MNTEERSKAAKLVARLRLATKERSISWIKKGEIDPQLYEISTVYKSNPISIRRVALSESFEKPNGSPDVPDVYALIIGKTEDSKGEFSITHVHGLEELWQDVIQNETLSAKLDELLA